MKTALITVIGNTGNEAGAIRQSLEAFGISVITLYIGRPNDFIDVLEGNVPLDPDFVIISCHGENGKILMPELAESVYAEDEPRGPFSAADVCKYLKLCGKLIICLGCCTGSGKLSDAFAARNTYIAPDDYIDGRAALFFTLRFFYELIQNGRSVGEAFESASATDSETALFRIFN